MTTSGAARHGRSRVSSPRATEAWPDSRRNGIGLVLLPLVLTVAGWVAVRFRHPAGRHRHAG